MDLVGDEDVGCKMFGNVGENFPMEREKQDCYIRRDDSTVREFERDTMTVT